MYSTNSELAIEVCKTIGADPGINFVKAMRRGGRIYVSATTGKPNEWRWLREQCEKHGYIYRGR